MKIDISNKVPFSTLKPGDRGTIDGKPFLRIAALVDPSVSCGGMTTAVSLETGAPLCISPDTLVEVQDKKARDDSEPQLGDVWLCDDGDYVHRIDRGWANVATGVTYNDRDIERFLVCPVDVKLVRA